jgi:hypothetical protein
MQDVWASRVWKFAGGEGDGIVGKHAVRRCNGKGGQRKHKNRGRGVVTASSVSMAGLLAGGLVLAPHTTSAADAATAVPRVQEDLSLAATLMFIDGHVYPDSGMRMLTQLQGNVEPNTTCPPCVPLAQPAPTDKTVFVQYPPTLGLLDGPTAPTGDQSVTAAQTVLEGDLQSLNPPPSPTNPVTVVAYSQGAVAASHEVPKWPAGSGIAFLLIANPERPNGGILARFPAGTYIPLVGITAGNATQSNSAPVVMVTRQYDGVADAPVYIGNVLADINALLGAYYLHSTYYSVNPNDPTNHVTTSPDGTMTDILVPAAPGALPIFIPLAQAGVPQAVLVALDPVVRALIETGYNRTSDPSQQIPFAFLPPASAWAADAQAVAAGFDLTAQELPAALAASLPTLPGLPVLPSTPSPATAPAATGPTSATQLTSQLRASSPVQPTSSETLTSPMQHTLTNATNNTGSSVVQPETGIPTTSALEPTAGQTVSTPKTGVPTVDRTPEKINAPRLTATTERTLSDRTSRSEAATSGANPVRSPANSAAEVRSSCTKSSHPQPNTGVADRHTEKS